MKFGFGNWNSVSEALGGSKTPAECENHYKQVFLNKTTQDLEKYKILSFRNENGCISEQNVSNFEFFNKHLTEEDPVHHFEKKNDVEKSFLSEFVGFVPLRKDFDIEYENDIELYLSDLEFYDDDRPEDIGIKLKQLDVYLKVLDEREERKTFVIERWPQEVKTEKRFKNNVIERNAYYSIKPFARFLPFDKHLSFCEALIKENLLKFKLEELKDAKLKGIRTEEEFKKFLTQKKNTLPNKTKEYEILLKEQFSYKVAEIQKIEIIKNLEDEAFNEKIENEFCQRLGITLDQFLALKDKISGNMESRITQNEENCDETCKKEFIDFIIKSKNN